MHPLPLQQAHLEIGVLPGKGLRSQFFGNASRGFCRKSSLAGGCTVPSPASQGTLWCGGVFFLGGEYF